MDSKPLGEHELTFQNLVAELQHYKNLLGTLSQQVKLNMAWGQDALQLISELKFFIFKFYCLGESTKTLDKMGCLKNKQTYQLSERGIEESAFDLLHFGTG